MYNILVFVFLLNCNLCSTKKMIYRTRQDVSLALKRAICWLITFVVHDQTSVRHRYVVSRCWIFYVSTQSGNNQQLSPQDLDILFSCNSFSQHLSSHFSLPSTLHVSRVSIIASLETLITAYQLKLLTATLDIRIRTFTVVWCFVFLTPLAHKKNMYKKTWN